MLRVCEPLSRVAALPPWPTVPFLFLASGCRGAAPRVEASGSGPCFWRCILCGLNSGHASMVWCLRFGSWFCRCSQCVVTGGPVPGPALAVLSVLRLPFARGARSCRPSRGSGRCAVGSLRGCVGFLPAVRCTPCVWGWGRMPLMPVLSLHRWGCCGTWCRAAVCGCSPCFGCYTPCRPGSGYVGVSWCLRFGLW